MSTDQPEAYSILTPPPPPPPAGVFATRVPSTVTFAIGLFLFILPFAELKCKLPDQKQNDLLNLTKLNFSFTNSGIGLAFGSDWKLNFPGGGDLFQNEKGFSLKKNIKSQKPNNYAIVALFMAFLGLGLSFINETRFAIITTVTGAISAGALIGLMIDLNKKSKDIISEVQKAGDGINVDHPEALSLNLNFTPWFYIAIISMLAAAIFSYMRILKRQT
jgi:hypothetical protein